MAGAKREVTLDLLARDKTGAATKKAADNLDNVADAADRASDANETLSDSFDALEGATESTKDEFYDTELEVDKLGKTSKSTADRVSKLSREIEDTEGKLRGLHEEFADTNDEAARLDLSKAIRKTQNDLRRLEKSKGVLAALLPSPAEVAQESAKVGKAVGSSVAESTTSALEGLAKITTPALVGIGIAAAPLLGATISAAIIGGAGGAGVIGGVTLAAKDPRVKAAATVLGSSLLNRLEIRANSFVDPVLGAIKQIQDGFDASADDMGRLFQAASKFVQPLTASVVSFLGNVTHGVAELAENAGPVIEVISKGIDGLGQAIERVFEDLSDNGVDAAVALDSVFKTLEVTILAVGGAINLLTESYGFLAKVGAFGSDAAQQYAQLEANAKIAAAANDDVVSSLVEVDDAGKGVAESMIKMIDGMDAAAKSAYGQRDAVLALNSTLRAQTDPVFGLLDAQGRLKKAEEETAEAVEEHGRSSDEAKEALRREAAAILEVQGRAGELGEAFNGKLSPALRQTLRDGGMTEQQIRDLEKQFREAKKSGDKFAKDYHATATLRVRTFGLATAQAALATAQALSGYRAGGGDVKAGHAYIVGEKRAEVFVPKQDGTIVKSVDDYMAQGGGGQRAGWGDGGGPRRTAVQLELYGERAVVELFSRLVRTANLLET